MTALENILSTTLLNVKDESIISSSVRVVAIGIGGAGCNTIDYLMNIGIKGVECIAMNTDKQHLSTVRAHKKILLGPNTTRGRGAGGDPRVGRKAAEESRDQIREVIEGADLVFVTAGLGGGTGTGALPVIAEEINSCKAIGVGVVTMPSSFELGRIEVAREGLKKIYGKLTTIAVIENDRLYELVPTSSLLEAFSLANKVLADMVKGVAEAITLPSMINLDFSDVKTVMQCGGLAMIGIGEASGANRAEEAIKQALDNPLLDVDLTNIKGILLHISGGKDLKVNEIYAIANMIKEYAREDAIFIYGLRVDESMKDKVRVVVMLTGIDSKMVNSPLTKRDIVREFLRDEEPMEDAAAIYDHLGIKEI